MNSFDITELNRRVANLLTLGTVIDADYGQARVRVQIGEIATTWLPWMTRRAGGDSDWWAPEIGEQVMVLSPSGELAQGIVLLSLYSDAHPAPVNEPTQHHSRYADGAVLEYDRKTHHLKAQLPAGATAEVIADGGVTIVGDVSVTGHITASGDISDHTRSMQAGRDIYNGHDHTGDSGGKTSTPGAQQ